MSNEPLNLETPIETPIETKDAHFKPTTWSLVALLTMMVAGLIFVFTVYKGTFAKQRDRTTAVDQTNFPQPQPGHFSPELLAQLRAHETAELKAYKWANADHSEAQVSIDRAIELYEEHHAK